MEEERGFCVICSAVILPVVEEDTKKDDTNLASLKRLLLKKCGESGGGSSGENQFLEETLTKLEEAKYTLCEKCHGVTQGALESKARAEGMEVQVRQLQGKLLEMLRGLQQEMEVFQQEMSKMGDIIVIRGETSKDDEEMGLRHLEEADMVREEILEVVTELRFYQADLQDKLILNRVEEQSMLEVSLNEVEVGFVSEVQVENEEEVSSSIIDDLIYGGNIDLEQHGSDKGEENETGPTEEETGEWRTTENNSRYVGHTIGLASEEEEEEEEENNASASARRKLRRSFGWKEELPFICNLCNERIATQNKLTRHMKRIHGQFPGAEKAERLRKPAVRYNNEAVAEEILSKALVCMTKNVEDKDRNTKTRAERKKERQEKLAALRAQWKTLRKSIQKKSSPMTSVTLKREWKKKDPSQKRKDVPPKIRKTGKISVPRSDHDNTSASSDNTKKCISKISEDVVQANTEVLTVPPSTALKKKPKVDKPVKEPRQPLRRSTRGRCTLEMKDILTQILEAEKKTKTTHMEISPETET